MLENAMQPAAVVEAGAASRTRTATMWAGRVRGGTPAEVFDAMVAKYPDHGNRHTLFIAALSQFPG